MSGAGDFAELRERARRCLATAGGRCAAAALERAVFGASGGAIWTRLLDQALSGDPQLRRDGDEWELLPQTTRALSSRDSARGSPPSPPGTAGVSPAVAFCAAKTAGHPPVGTRPAVPGGTALASLAPVAPAEPHGYVVLDVEATGGRPERHRVTEVAALVVVDGQTVLTYQSAVNPRRRLPALLRDRTGLTQELADEAPGFEEIADDLLEAITDLPIVGHEVHHQLAFIQHELDRLGRPPLLNPRHELIELAGRWLPASGARKPSLENLARAAGVGRPPRRGAYRDARVIAAICGVLDARAHAAGEAGLLAPPPPAAEPAGPVPIEAEPVGPPLPALRDPFVLGRAPEALGIYRLRDADGAVVYLGRSVNLRQRLQSYAAGQLGFTRQLEGLLDAVASVEWETLDSDLAAMLVEARELRAYSPRFNVQHATSPPPLWLKLDVLDEFPRLSLAHGPRPDGALYFGPYRTGAAAARILAWATATIPLRTCRRRLGARRNPRLAPCARLARGLCPGPCTGGVTPDAYRPIAEAAAAFLAGDRLAAERFVRERLAEAVARGDRPAADRWRGQVIRLQHVDPTADRIADPEPPADALILLPAPDARAAVSTLVIAGAPHLGPRLSPDAEPAEIAERLRGAWIDARTASTEYAVADGALLARWWRERPERAEAAVLPVRWPTSAASWAELADRALAATRELPLRWGYELRLDVPAWLDDDLAPVRLYDE